MFSVQGKNPAGKTTGVYTTYERKVSDGKPFIKPTVHIPLKQQKWVPQNIAKGEYGSLEKVKAKYPGMKVTIIEKTKDKVVYNVEDAIDVAYITVKQTKKGEVVEIGERRWGEEARYVSATYENGQLKSARNDYFYEDPWTIE